MLEATVCGVVAGQWRFQAVARPRGPGGESCAVDGGMIASLVPHFHGEEALRKGSWVFS